MFERFFFLNIGSWSSVGLLIQWLYKFAFNVLDVPSAYVLTGYHKQSVHKRLL